jgi:hypothetical protein
MLLPDSVTLKIQIPYQNVPHDHTCYASFDGRHRIELNKGDYISVTVSNYYCPTLVAHDPVKLTYIGIYLFLSQQIGLNRCGDVYIGTKEPDRRDLLKKLFQTL